MMVQKFNFKNRRAVSNIIGSLIVLAIVASVGSVILFQGLNQINAFNYDLTLHEKERVNELREDIIFEHVRFDKSPSLDPNGDELQLFIANIGTVDSNIISITMVKLDTQELIFNRFAPDANESYIPIEDHTVINLEATLGAAPDDVWDSTFGPPSVYKITLGTAKGNFYSWTGEPFT